MKSEFRLKPMAMGMLISDDEGRVEDEAEQAMEEAKMATLGPAHLPLLIAAVAAIRPSVQNDGGDIELVAVEGGVVRVRLTGACTHCHMVGQTLGTLRRHIVQATGIAIKVLPAIESCRSA